MSTFSPRLQHPGRFLSAAVVWLAAAGCDEPRPFNPAAEVMATPPHETDNPWVTDVTVLVNGNPLIDRIVEVQEGGTMHITGAMTIDESAFSGRVHTRRDMRIMPAGTSNAAWDHANRTWKFAAKHVISLSEEGRTVDVKMPPGEYDVRIYCKIQGRFDDLPVFPLIAKGQVRVLPRTE